MTEGDGGGEDDKGCPDCGEPYNRFYEELDAYHCPNKRCDYVASEKEVEQHTQGGEDDDSVLEVLDEYDVEYQRERRHGKRWLQIRAGYEIGPHIVDGLRAFGYRFHGFASDTTMNFVKVEDDDKAGVRGRQEIREKIEELRSEISRRLPKSSPQWVARRKSLEWVLGEVDDL